MADLATIRTRIDQIDAILAAGVSSATVGDQRIDYDLAALRSERDRLSRVVSASSSSQFRRVVFRNG